MTAAYCPTNVSDYSMHAHKRVNAPPAIAGMMLTEDEPTPHFEPRETMLCWQPTARIANGIWQQSTIHKAYKPIYTVPLQPNLSPEAYKPISYGLTQVLWSIKHLCCSRGVAGGQLVR